MATFFDQLYGHIPATGVQKQKTTDFAILILVLRARLA